MDQLAAIWGKDLQPSGETSSDVRKEFAKLAEFTPSGVGPSEPFAAEVGKTVMKQPTLLSCEVSSGTVEFDCGDWPSASEPKLAEFSLSDLLSD